MTRSLTLELPDDVADEIAQANDPAAYVAVAIRTRDQRSDPGAPQIRKSQPVTHWTPEEREAFLQGLRRRAEALKDPAVRADSARRLESLRIGRWPL